MNVAIVHELLTTRGGAEWVAKVIADMFPEAPIYTLLYDEKKLGDWFPKERVRGYVNSPLRGFNHHNYLSKFPSVVEHWDFSAFDLVIGSSSAFAHGIITNGRPKHLCYVHSPARYLWDMTHEVVNTASRGLLGPLKRRYLERLFHRLRVWDAEAADRPDMLLANSETVRRRIELYWRRESEILHPPVDDFWFEKTDDRLQIADQRFLIVSTLAPYKRIDLAIEACNRLKKNLIIVGEGRDGARLERMAGPTVTFKGHLPREDVRELHHASTALLFPGHDDFGLVPVEAMACGSPVIAYGKGGAPETVIAGKTGEFFEEQTVESLQNVLQKFDHKKYSREACAARAKEFSRARFESGLRAAIERLMR